MSTGELYNKFLTHKEKFEYKKLSKSNINSKLKILFYYNKNLLFCEKYLYKKMGFILTLSKFVDFKINSNKNSFRCKNKSILIEEIASVIANKVLINNDCKLFKEYYKLKYQYNLRQKEDKIFKLLLAKNLMLILCQLEDEIKKLSTIIKNAKYTTQLKKYNKKILENAQIYGIKKYNPNSRKVLLNYKIKSKQAINSLIFELLNAELKIKIIIEYLTAMFS